MKRSLTTPKRVTRKNLVYIYILYTPPKFNITPEKWWLEDDPFLLILLAYFQGLLLLNFGRVNCFTNQTSKTKNLENLGKCNFFRQLWLVLGVKLMEINSNWFSRNKKTELPGRNLGRIPFGTPPPRRRRFVVGKTRVLHRRKPDLVGSR